MTTYNNQFICGNDGDALDVSAYATSGNRSPAEWFLNWSAGGEFNRNDAGVTVNGYTALTHCPLWQGVNIIAGDFGQTPVRLLKDEFDEQRNHPAWKLLRVRPNKLQTPSVWKETMMQWALIWGNGVSWIRKRGSRPDELIPLRPDCLWPELISFEDEQILLYHYYSPSNNEKYVFFPDEVIHFQGLTSDGVWGYELFQIAKNTIGHGLAIEKHGNTTFSNGAVPSGVLQAPSGVTALSKSKENRKMLRDEWNEVHRGPDKAGAIAILWEGVEYKQTSSTNIDAQWIEAKRVGVYESASLLNLPPHKLGVMDGAKYNNVEEQNADYVNRTLNRHYNRADEEYRRKLLTDKEWQSDQYQFEHDVEAFMKGDIDTLTTVADRCIKAELMNRNEGRRMIGLAPYKGGEKFGSPSINPQDGGKPRFQNDPNTPQQSPKKPTNKVLRAEIDAAAVREAKIMASSVKAHHAAEIRDRLTRVLAREQSALCDAAKSEKNFIEWLDKFYGRDGLVGDVGTIFNTCMHKTKRFQASKTDIDAVRERFIAWSQDRKESLLDLCSTATAETLANELNRFNEITTINSICSEILEMETEDGTDN